MPTEAEALRARLAELEAEEEDQKPEAKKTGAGDLRQKLEDALKAQRDSEKTVSSLQKELGTYREKEKTEVFDGLKVAKEHRELFAKLNPDVQPTKEAVSAFLTEYALPVPTEDGTQQVPQDPDAGPRFKPTVPQDAAQLGAKRYTTAEWDELFRVNQAEADKVLREGRIIREAFNPGGPQF